MIYLLERIESIRPDAVLAKIGELSLQRQAQVASFHAERTKLQSVLAELLLKYAVERECGLHALPEIAFAEQGKPYFAAMPDCCFNLSHCKTAVACVVDHSPVGVDVQELRRWKPTLSRVLSKPERLWVEDEDSDARFTQLWTLKEAYGKERGVGILYEMRSTQLVPQGAVWQAQGRVFQSFTRQGFFLSVCAERALPLVVVSPEELSL